MARTMRQQAAETVTGVFLEDDRIAIVLAEISTDYFERAFAHDPLRAVNVGIMEQTMVGVAAGFALEGFHPVAHTITPFLAERALEQVKLDFGNQELGGTLFSTGASYDYGTDGATHYSPGDVQALATIPGIRIAVPGHPDEVDTLMRHALAGDDLTYLRTQAIANARPREIEPGRIEVVRRGEAGTVLAIGPMLDRVLEATGDLDLTVLYATTVWPLDAGTLAREAAHAPDVIVVEPFYAGTLAAPVTEALADRASRIRSIGIPRRIPREYGTPAQHDREFGLDAAGVGRQIRALASAPTGGLDAAAAGRS
jgi:transketolase